MTALLSTFLRKATPTAGMLALTVILTGCGPENGEHILPYTHNPGLGDGGQLISVPLTDMRHHQHAQHLTHIRHHPPPL